MLGDLLKEEVRAAPLFVPLYNYYLKYGGVYNLGEAPRNPGSCVWSTLYN